MSLPTTSPAVLRSSSGVASFEGGIGASEQVCCRLNGLLGDRNKRKCKWRVGHRICWNEYQTKAGYSDGEGSTWGECKDDARRKFKSGGWHLVSQTLGSDEIDCFPDYLPDGIERRRPPITSPPFTWPF